MPKPPIMPPRVGGASPGVPRLPVGGGLKLGAKAGPAAPVAPKPMPAPRPPRAAIPKAGARPRRGRALGASRVNKY